MLLSCEGTSMTVKLAGVSQGYWSVSVIENLDLELTAGVVGLLGPNGAGKTTLLRTMATILPPRTGTITIDDILVDSESRARDARRRIGYLPQDFGFDPGMRVQDFVRYAAWIRGIPAGQWDAVADVALQRVDLAERRRTKMRTLSGGMRQRAGIAWAIVGEPTLVLLDEPTVGLDPRQRLQFRSVISSLKSSVVVLSTHLIDDVDAICDHVVVLQRGAPTFVGTTSDLATLAREDLPGATAIERAYMGLLPKEQQHL